MSKPSSRGKPLETPPSEETMLRSARSFMSMTRRQVMRRSSNAELVAPVDVVVDQGREQVVGRADGVEVAGEMQVDVFHRHDLGIAAAGRTALDAEAGAEAGLAQADHRLLADAVEAVAEADRGRGLALARRRRGDRGDQDQLAVGLGFHAVDEIERDLRLARAVAVEMLLVDAELLPPPARSAASSLPAQSRYRCRPSWPLFGLLPCASAVRLMAPPLGYV